MSTEGEKTWKAIKYFELVRGLEVAVMEDDEYPGTVCVSVLGTINGLHDVVEIDKCDSGAVARALSLAEILHVAISAAEESWFADETAA